MKLSVIVPSIRPQNLLKLYQSIDIEGNWEFIVVGPQIPILRANNIKFIESFRSPNACQQQGLLESSGEYITFAADDGEFKPCRLVQLLNLYSILHLDYKTILVCKYLEGNNPQNMESDDYYTFKYHQAYRFTGVPRDNFIFNCGIISRKFMLELGGWDCSFEATTCAHADLGIRASQAGARMFLMDSPLFKCSHQPGKTGDHKPIHEAMKSDLKIFKELYSKPRQTNIDIENWKNTSEIWDRRFGKLGYRLSDWRGKFRGGSE